MAKLLLVEDTEDLAQVIVREFESAGYDVLHAANGETALRLHAEQYPDVIILDWMLPGIDGLEVLRRIRQTAAAPVLMLTARDEEIDRVMGIEVGADDYLTKPFSMRELVVRVRALLRRVEMYQRIREADHRASSDAVIDGTLMIDPDAYRVTLDGGLLDLSRTEFNLLHLLARNPGRTFSRDYLMSALWDEHYVEGDRVVDYAVMRLRKKLDAYAHRIETVWGVGYRWLSE
jgi:DNA-binding response OmpR family regulator